LVEEVSHNGETPYDRRCADSHPSRQFHVVPFEVASALGTEDLWPLAQRARYRLVSADPLLELHDFMGDLSVLALACAVSVLAKESYGHDLTGRDAFLL
jgi:hypothetical protein